MFDKVSDYLGEHETLVWAAIIAVPAAITGFLRPNVPYPASADSPASWPVPPWYSSLMVVLYVMFRRRDWL